MRIQSKNIVLSTLLLGSVLASVAFAQQAPKPEQLIKWRQSAYQVIGWNASRIKANVDGQYNKDEVVKSANAIAAVANAGLGSLFVAGTETGKGWHETSAKPELFKDAQRAGELSGAFNREANELARIASSSDAAGVKVQFGQLQRTCKACHDEFRAKD